MTASPQRAKDVKANEASSKNLVLNSGVFVYAGKDYVRFRRGIWSHSQFIVSLRKDSEALRNCFRDVIQNLRDGREFHVIALAATHKITEAELKEMNEILQTLERTGYLSRNAPTVEGGESVARLIGGTLSPFIATQVDPSKVKIMAIADTDGLYEIASSILQTPNVSRLDSETMARMENEDLTNRVDAIRTDKVLGDVSDRLSGTDIFLLLFSSPNPMLINNLNRVFLHPRLRGRYVVAGISDNDFLHLVVLKPGITACLECLTLRQAATMTDITDYNTFLSEIKGKFASPTDGKESKDPTDYLLVSLVCQEVKLISFSAMSRFLGQALSMFLPLFEVQTYKILRVPFCPACGVDNAKIANLYYDTDRLVEEIATKTELTDSSG